MAKFIPKEIYSLDFSSADLYLNKLPPSAIGVSGTVVPVSVLGGENRIVVVMKGIFNAKKEIK